MRDALRRHCEPSGRANARPMTGSTKQSGSHKASLDCVVATLLAMTTEQASRPRRSLQQQGMDAAGAIAHAQHPCARLAAGAHFRHVDSVSQKPRPGGVDVCDAPTQAPELIVSLVGAG